jgi:hypothetical protein
VHRGSHRSAWRQCEQEESAEDEVRRLTTAACCRLFIFPLLLCTVLVHFTRAVIRPRTERNCTKTLSRNSFWIPSCRCNCGRVTSRLLNVPAQRVWGQQRVRPAPDLAPYPLTPTLVLVLRYSADDGGYLLFHSKVDGLWTHTKLTTRGSFLGLIDILSRYYPPRCTKRNVQATARLNCPA